MGGAKSPIRLLLDLRAAGLELRVQGEAIRFRPTELMTPELSGWVRALKQDLLRILRDEQRFDSEPARSALRICEGQVADPRELDRIHPRRPLVPGEMNLGGALRHLDDLTPTDPATRRCYACGNRRRFHAKDAPADRWVCARCSPPPEPTSDRLIWSEPGVPNA